MGFVIAFFFSWVQVGVGLHPFRGGVAAVLEVPVGGKVVGDKVPYLRFTGDEGELVGGAARLDDIEDYLLGSEVELGSNFVEVGLIGQP